MFKSVITVKYNFFYLFFMKAYVAGTHQKRLAEALLMSTHNICFHDDIRKALLMSTHNIIYVFMMI